MTDSSAYAIVIPTAGRSLQLEACLRSLRRLPSFADHFHIIVVDNNTEPSLSARVQEIVSSSSASYGRCSSPGLTAARHKALELTTADVLCFVDDDVEFTDKWFTSIANAFRDPGIAVLGGPTIPRLTASVPSWFWDFVDSTPYGGWSCSWLSLLDIGHDVDTIDPNWIWGLNFAIRRDVLLDCGGFHIDLVPRQYMRWQGDGETGLTKQLAERGYRAAYRQDSLLIHQCGPDRLNPDYFARRAYYQGVCNSYTELRKKLRSEVAETVASSAEKIQHPLRTALRRVKSGLHSLLPIPRVESRWEAAAADVRTLCQEAELQGYMFHQLEAARDPALREWIARDHYFDVDLRQLQES